MNRDILGNEVKEGDTVLFNNIVFKVTKIQNSHLLRGGAIDKMRVTGVVIASTMTLEHEVNYDHTKPLNLLVLKTPSNQDLANLAGDDKTQA